MGKLYRNFSTTNPVANSSSAATPGVSGNIARSDHTHPRINWDATDYGWISQTVDIGIAATNSAPTGLSTLQVAKMRTPIDITVTNILVYVAVIGTSLTSGQNFAALYNSAGTLLAQTTDQTAAWGSTGFKTMALTAAQSVTAGDFYVVYWVNGSAAPTFRTGANSTSVNGGLTGNNARFASADGSITTTAPGTLGTRAAQGFSWWFAIS